VGPWGRLWADDLIVRKLAVHFVQQAKGIGWTVLIDETQGAKDNERLVLEGIKSHLVDGLILSPLALAAKDVDARRDPTPPCACAAIAPRCARPRSRTTRRSCCRPRATTVPTATPR
jgi:hypothetical protein